jgi:hypothetical protein
MKTVVLSLASLLCLQGVTNAQRSSSSSKTDTSIHANTRGPVTADDTTADLQARVPSKMVLISQMDQKRIYNWGDGQRSTPAGRQAGDPNAIYARVLGDSAIVVLDWRQRLKANSNGTVHN